MIYNNLSPDTHKFLIALPAFAGEKGFTHQTLLVKARDEHDAYALAHHLRPTAILGDIVEVDY